MLLPNIIKVTCGTEWMFTFDIQDPFSGAPVSPEISLLKYSLFETPQSTHPLWSCGWNTGIQQDPIIPGRVHIYIPDAISKYLPEGIYTFVIDVVSKDHETYTKKLEGTLQSIPMPRSPGNVVLGETDPIARKLVGEETKRAMTAEEALSEEIQDLVTGVVPAGSITTEKLADASVTAEKLAPNSVTRDKLASGAIPEPTVEDGSITTSKLHDEAVTTSKIQDGAVTAEKLASGAIDRDKIADESISAPKLDPSLVANLDNVAEAVADLFRIGTVTPLEPGETPTVHLLKNGSLWYFNFGLLSGFTPEIGQDGFWYFNGDKSEYRAIGRDGAGIISIEKTDVDPENNKDTYTISWGIDGVVSDTSTFEVYNGLPSPAVSEFSEIAVTSGGVYNDVHKNSVGTVVGDKLSLNLSEGTGEVISGYSTTESGTVIPAVDETINDNGTTVVLTKGIKSLIDSDELDGTSLTFRFDFTGSLPEDPETILATVSFKKEEVLGYSCTARGYAVLHDGTSNFVTAAEYGFDSTQTTSTLILTVGDSIRKTIEFTTGEASSNRSVNPYAHISDIDYLTDVVKDLIRRIEQIEG